MKNKNIIQFNKTSLFIFLFVLNCFYFNSALAQKKKDYNLVQLSKENKLILNGKSIKTLEDYKNGAVATDGVIWLKDVDFAEGTIELDLRGKDVFQQSFLGIAFHGVDTATYDAIYFRPFNFHAKDSIRRIHAVQYMSLPSQEWNVLREQFPGQYEKAVKPAPNPNEWFHAKFVVKGSEIKVYVNNSSEPSLSVNKLNSRKNGMIGIWGNGDFANLSIDKSSK